MLHKEGEYQVSKLVSKYLCELHALDERAKVLPQQHTKLNIYNH